MKLTLTFTLIVFYLSCFSQNRAEVKAYYNAHNHILENFARSKDTTKYLDEMYAFITLNGKKYVRLTHHNSFLDLCLEQKDYKLAKLIVATQLKYNVMTHYRLKDTAARNGSSQNEFYNSPEILELINHSDREYKDLMGQVNLFKSIQLNSLMEIDQFGRSLTDIDTIWKNRHLSQVIGAYTDSTNVVKIYEFIEENGFPNQDEVGYIGYFIIMWHTYCRPCGHTYTLPNGQLYYNYLDSVFYEAVLDGLYANTEYAFLKDQSLNQQWSELYKNCDWKGQKYVTKSAGKIDHTLYDAKNIDQHRAEIYLPPYWVDAVLNGWEIPADYPIPENVKLKY